MAGGASVDKVNTKTIDLSPLGPTAVGDVIDAVTDPPPPISDVISGCDVISFLKIKGGKIVQKKSARRPLQRSNLATHL